MLAKYEIKSALNKLSSEKQQILFRLKEIEKEELNLNEMLLQHSQSFSSYNDIKLVKIY